jgi:hypothetical protein
MGQADINGNGEQYLLGSTKSVMVVNPFGLYGEYKFSSLSPNSSY